MALPNQESLWLPSRARERSRCPNPTADDETLLPFSSPNAQAGYPFRRTGHPSLGQMRQNVGPSLGSARRTVGSAVEPLAQRVELLIHRVAQRVKSPIDAAEACIPDHHSLSGSLSGRFIRTDLVAEGTI